MNNVTLREFLEQHPRATVDIMTPCGMTVLNPSQVKELLDGKTVRLHAGVSDVWNDIPAEVLLDQMIQFMRPHDQITDYFSMLTVHKTEQQEQKAQCHGTMQTQCLKGKREFEWDEVGFDDDVIEEYGILSFYMPIWFDAEAVFGEKVRQMGPSDSLNVYASYDLENGEVCDYLNVVFKLANGKEESAAYQLSSDEKDMLLQRMEHYCQDKMGRPLPDWQMEYMTELVEKQAFAPHQMGGIQ